MEQELAEKAWSVTINKKYKEANKVNLRYEKNFG